MNEIATTAFTETALAKDRPGFDWPLLGFFALALLPFKNHQTGKFRS